ncbi:MAG: DUF308 domain-containing protein [Atopobiaceae bacterium]|nr:DUF308 domain-containing protein [Atopobiaceae bacterium]
MRSSLMRSKSTILLTGAVMVALGVAVLINPIRALETIISIMGWILVGYGVLTIVPIVVRHLKLGESLGDVSFGAVSLVLGLFMAIFPSNLISFVWTLIGILILATGLLDIVESGTFRQQGSPLGIPATVSGVICVLLGVLVIWAPMLSPTLGMLIAAIALIINGITEIIFGLGM